MELNHAFHLRDVGVSNALHNPMHARHRWYAFKEAFAPDLVKAAIADAHCTSADLVLDPFCGSGTVPVVAATEGLRAQAFEVNPFFAFMSRAKLSHARADSFAQASEKVGKALAKRVDSHLEGFSTFSPRRGAKNWLFNLDVLRAFESGWQAAAEIDGPAGELCRLALIGATMDSANAKRDGKCLRYITGWRMEGRSGKDVEEAFRVRTAAIHEDLSGDRDVLPGAGEIVEGDSRNAMTADSLARFRLCVTSPPYLNSFDYTDVYRPELFLGRFVRDMKELRALRFRTLRSHLQVDWPRPAGQELSPLLGRCLGHLKEREALLWNRRIPVMVQAYFEDMSQILTALRQRATDQAVLWLVVSTSAYGGVEVPVDLILADVASKCGWSLREVGVLRHLRTAGQHWERWGKDTDEKPRLRESVIILDARRRAPARRSSRHAEQP